MNAAAHSYGSAPMLDAEDVPSLHRQPSFPVRIAARLSSRTPFKQGGSFFSNKAGWHQRCAYSILFTLFFVFLIVVLCSPFIEPQCLAQDVKTPQAPYSNQHYVLRCKDVRYTQLLGLTARECDLGRRMVFALVCGGAVGFERRRGDRPAGIRTMALVALGACIFTITSIFAFQDGPMSWDSSRVAAAIPSGVGFLGAGLIWKLKVRPEPDSPEHEQIHGLTTAASAWVAAAVGIASGGGLYFVAVFGVMALLSILRFGPRTAAHVEAEGRGYESGYDTGEEELKVGLDEPPVDDADSARRAAPRSSDTHASTPRHKSNTYHP
ncbi:MgtC family-domain-containing protein [Pelagophyceae sp. CCMP2097]|nr:MgtC family-domain-containing protein [Pelagophyceae sp. CCMP2097]